MKVMPWITDRSKQDASDAWSAMHIWVIPISVLACMWIASFAYNHIRRRSAVGPAEHAHGPSRQAYSSFKPGYSRLDTDGTLLRSWDAEVTVLLRDSPMHGWFNLCVILVTTWVFANSIYSIGRVGSTFEDHITVLMNYFSLFMALLVEGLAYFVATYTFQVFLLHVQLPVPVEYAVQAALECAMFFGPLAYVRWQSRWSVLQRFAFGMQAAVLTMKMHSYITSNRHLKRDIASGGQGSRPGSFVESAKQRRAKYGPVKPAAELQTPIKQDAYEAVSTSSFLSQALYSFNKTLLRESIAPHLIRRRRSLAAAIGRIIKDGSTHSSRPRGDTQGTVEKQDLAVGAINAPEQRNAPTPGACSTPSVSTPGDSTPGENIPSESTPSECAPGDGALVPTKQAADDEQARVATANAEPSVGFGTVRYPDNINLKDFLVYSFAPTLVYEPNFPRTKAIRIGYLFEKLFFALGLLLAGSFILKNYFNPVLRHIEELDVKDAILQLLLPCTFATLIMFFVTFECVLNFFGELTHFGDRDFYRDWWNSTTFAEFSRKWNVCVHEFLLRHVYIDGMQLAGMSQTAAMYMTFLVSIIAHEAIIWAALTPTYPPPILAALSCMQFPLMSILRMPIVKGKAFGNFIFWAFLQFGIAMTIALYGRHYCSSNGVGCARIS